MKLTLSIFACLILGSALAFGQKNKVEMVNRIVYNSPNEKETFIKVANGTATPLNMLFAHATPDMGDIEASFLGAIRQTASSAALPPPSKGEAGKAAIEAYLKAIHDEYFLRYDPFATMSVTAYNKIFSNLTASVVYSMIFNEKNIKSYIYINGQNKNVQIGFAWGNNLCVFDPSFISTDPIRIISNDERQGYFKRLVQAKIILQEELSANTDSLYLASNYSASFLDYRGIAAHSYLNALARDPNAISTLETFYGIVKVDLLNDKLLNAGFIDSYLTEEIQSSKYKLNEELMLLYFHAMYATTADRFNTMVSYIVSRRSNQTDFPKSYITFSNDVLKLELPESSAITVKRYLYRYLIDDIHSDFASEVKAVELLNSVNDILEKDSLINTSNEFNHYYESICFRYLERLYKVVEPNKKIAFYNTLYDGVNRRNLIEIYASWIVNDLRNEMSAQLARGKVPAALGLYAKIKQLKGDPFNLSNEYSMKYTLEALYNATRDKGMAKESQDVRKTINRIKQQDQIVSPMKAL